jgi:cardiolipin synthase
VRFNKYHAGLLILILILGGVIIGLTTQTINLSTPSSLSSSGFSISQKTPIRVSTWKVTDIQLLTGELLISPKTSWAGRAEQLQKATNFLYIWIYDVTFADAKNIIKSIAQQGAEVKMIIENNKYGTDKTQDLRWWGVQTMNDSKLRTNFMHAKTFVSSWLYIIQTANLTYSSFNTQREYYVLGDQPEIVNNLKMLFEKDWKGEQVQPSDIHPNILFCPIDCRFKIEQLIKTAQMSIRTQNQYLDDPSLQQILSTKTWLNIRIILPNDKKNFQSRPIQSQIKLLGSPRIHAKAILIDDTYLVISSINFSSNSMDNNREIGIIITDQESIIKYKKQFLQDREKAK